MIRQLKAWTEVDLDAISHNAKQIQDFVGDETEILAIVKASAYGHGIVETAATLVDAGIHYFGVATLEEALALKRNRISANVLLLTPSLEISLHRIVENDIIQTISSLEEAVAISKAATTLHKIATIHIKLDTGMSRLGIKADDKSADIIEAICNLPNLDVEAIFSHLSMSESFDKSYTQEQADKFKKVIAALEAKGIFLKKHLSNSGGILNNPELHFDMVRPGIILYGIYPTDEVPRVLYLKEAMQVKARVSHINFAEVGESVGYDRAFFATRPTKVGIMIVGYADGYLSDLSGKGHVLVNGHKAPIIQVCMDQTIIDLTDVPDVKTGDIITLLGHDGEEHISAISLSQLSSTKSRELLCITNLGKRIPRVYKKGGKYTKVEYL